jgi:hypothetical protein
VALLPAHEAFHEACLFIHQIHHVLFFRHPFIVGLPG